MTGEAASQIGTSAQHPLDPLSAAEFCSVRDILVAAGRVKDSTRFAVVQLREPPKAEVLAYGPGNPIDRQATTVLLDVANGEAAEAVVSVTRLRVLSWKRLDPAESTYGQPPLLMEEAQVISDVVMSDRQWQAAIANRGIKDLSLCVIVPMMPIPSDSLETVDGHSRRIVRGLTFWRQSARDNPWAHPVDGLIACVDVRERRVIRLIDLPHSPLPRECGNFSEGDWLPLRERPKTLHISQPEGPGFQVDGHQVSWQNWSFRVGFDQREGLTLHQVGYRDSDRIRPVIYRASLSEVVVPYGDPSPARSWISNLDVGEDLLGRATTPLTLGCDCLGEIYYFDAVLPDDHGSPYSVPNVICLHEEDHGVLWRHSDFFTGITESRRSRRLVISSFTAIGNYDYGFFWYLYQDGTIEFEVKLTGIVLACAQPDDQETPWAMQVAPGVAAPHHQHLFNVRLDMMVDGTRNSVEEVDAVPVPTGPENPHGNAFTIRRRLLARESEAARSADPAASREWVVINRGTRNQLGRPTGYKLVPHSAVTLLAQPDSAVAQCAGFAAKNLWVTQYDPSERYPAGEYPRREGGSAGLPLWQLKDRRLDDQDIVIWHTFGVTHVARPEEWPIMPVQRAGFTLKPTGFFDHNPSVNLPAPDDDNGCPG